MTQATELRELASLIRVHDGKIGIGPLTANPPYTLSLGQTSVAGAHTIRLAGNSNPKHEIQFREASTGYGFTFRYAGDATDNKLHIVQHENDATGTEVMTFKRDSMEVGIGTDSPDLLYEGLHIKSANPSLKIEGTATNSWEFIHLKQPNYDRLIGMRTTGNIVINSGTNLDANNMLVITNSGKVGINVEYPDHDLEVSGTAKAEQYLIDALAKDLSNDASGEVFVYDTRKDSDGGAWRHRTQNTSWYNETLNTSTRGARKEFPAVAIITADIDEGVRIYDADDPDVPMWMIFQRNKSGLQGSNSTNYINSVTALNGTMVVGFGSGMAYFNFLNEYIERAHPSDTNNTGEMPYNIAERNEPGAGKGLSRTMRIKAAWVSDVAMTVLPNAPIDLTTGLPVPTIAVATDGGVSVIKDDGTVADITQSTIYDTVREIDFTYENKIIYTMDNAASRSARVDSIPDTDFVVTSNQLSKGSGEEFYPGADFGYSNGDLAINLPTGSGNNINKVIGSSPNCREISTPQGINRIALESPDSPDKGLISYIASDYNTGWMNGDIKLATLSDTDDTDVTGSELVTNGTFATDTSGWSLADASGPYWSSIGVVGGVLQGVTDGGLSTGMAAWQDVTTVVGKTYVATLTGTASTNRNFGFYINGTEYATGSQSAPSVTATFVATSTTTTINLRVRPLGTDTTFTFDNISVRLAEADRSYNNNGLQVLGTVTKTAVATGADLVAYNTSPANTRLKLPNASDLAFGTGDFTIMMWIKEGTFNTNHYVMDKVVVDASGTGRLYVIINASGKHLFGIPNQSGITSTGTSVAEGIWQLVSFIRRSGTLYFGINGDIVDSASAPGDTEGGSTGQHAYIGDYSGGQANYGFDSMALFRASKTAVTNDQLRKIYNDEKHLFQENAKATLYGTTNVVTALSYDDDTELLHAGTMYGRSVFQGLRRIDNTTDAVGVDISASNGLVAED